MRVILNDVADRITGNVDRFNTDREFYVGGEHYECGGLALYDKGILKSEKGSTLGFKFHFPFESGDTLFMARNPHLKKAAMVTYRGICSDASYILRTKDPSVLLPKYLPLVIQNDRFWRFFEENKSGSVNYLMNWKEMKNYEFDLPSIEEQKRIVELVWSAEKARKAYISLVEKTDELVKSQFIEMFGELGKDDKGWGITTLGECCELNPKRPRNIDDDLMVSFVPMPAVSEDGKIDCSEVRPYKEVRKGFTYFAENDVLFAKITPCMENGKGAVAKGLEGGIASGSTEFHVLRPIAGESNPYWLYIITMFNSFRIGARKVMTGTGGQLRVPIGYLNDFPISLPPIELQDQFEQFVHQSEKSKFELRQAIERIEQLIKSLLEEYC